MYEPNPIIFVDLSGKFHSLTCTGFGSRLLAKIVRYIRLKLKIVRVTLFTSFKQKSYDLIEHNAIFKVIKDKHPSSERKLIIDRQNMVIEYAKMELLMRFRE